MFNPFAVTQDVLNLFVTVFAALAGLLLLILCVTAAIVAAVQRMRGTAPVRSYGAARASVARDTTPAAPATAAATMTQQPAH